MKLLKKTEMGSYNIIDGLKGGDIIGYSQSNQSLMIFRPDDEGEYKSIYFRSNEEYGPYPDSLRMPWDISQEEFKFLAELLAASMGTHSVPFGSRTLPSITWAYSIS